jgi:CDP-glycerol glycerophosphotransferase (TagB/SpsB family)
MKRFIKLIIKLVKKMIFKGVSFFVYKNRKKIFCMPDLACKANCVDIINYTADNTLSFINYLLKHYDKDKITLFLVYFDKQRLQGCINYVNSFNNKNIKVRFVYLNYSWNSKQKMFFKDSCNYYFCFFQSKYILNSDVTMRFPYKLNSQIYISLNYFTPFKLDRLKIDLTTKIEYVVSTSQLSSQIVSGSCKVPIENFQVLGFPRNDIIFNPRYSREKFIEMLGLDYVVRKIIVYTPTHRDYERNSMQRRNMLGYEDTYDDFNKLLETEKAILIIKLHPIQNRDCMINLEQSRIIVYEPNYHYTLYDILSYTDIMLTDYTSTYFDFLLRNKPVIFNFHDQKKYETTRGFSYDPVEAVCAGPIVKDRDSFFLTIKEALSGKDEYASHRNLVNSLMNKYTDGNSSERIFNFFKTQFIL